MKKYISLIVIALYFFAARAAGSYPTVAELRKSIGNPPEYAVFHFEPRTPIAEILFATGLTHKQGYPFLSWGRALAKGEVKLPTNSELQINLRFDGLSHMDQLPQLSKCYVGYFNAADLDFEDSHLRYLAPLKTLRLLNLNATLVTDKSLPQIGTYTNLEVLNLKSTNITGNGFEHLKNLTKLRELTLEGLNLKPGEVFKLKPVLPGLILFRINRCNLSKADAAICKDLKSARELIVCSNAHVDNDCVQYFIGLNNLKTLDISDTPIDEKSVPQLIKLPNLVDVRIREKTFWKHLKHPAKIGKVAFTDVAKFCDAPTDVFQPLH